MDNDSILFPVERKCNSILGFFGEYRFLSNYHLCNCVFESEVFPSSEHVYMYQKSYDPVYRGKIRIAETPKEAKLLGSKVHLRHGWDSYRKIAMFNALEAKFNNLTERSMLLDTGDAYLEETNSWSDTYWGVCQGIGENNLGKMLMRFRDKFKKELYV